MSGRSGHGASRFEASELVIGVWLAAARPDSRRTPVRGVRVVSSLDFADYYIRLYSPVVGNLVCKITLVLLRNSKGDQAHSVYVCKYKRVIEAWLDPSPHRAV